jgi:hypothetical protein
MSSNTNENIEQQEKDLRRNCMALSVKKYNWDYDQFHDLLEEWGYGRSLRALGLPKLIQLRNQLVGIKDHSGYAKFDSDGMHMWHLACRAWPDNTMSRLQHYWVKKFRKSHWNILDAKERRQTKAMLKEYGGKR